MPASTTAIYVVAAVIILLILFGAVVLSRRNRSRTLQNRFGQEYQQAIRESGGSRAEAVRDRANRQERMKRMETGQIPPDAKSRYTEEWMTVQTRFHDEPQAALANADRLIADVMRDRGYPTDPGVLQNYRTAHEIAQRSESGDASTEDVRQAMVRYRSLIDDLLK